MKLTIKLSYFLFFCALTVFSCKTTKTALSTTQTAATAAGKGKGKPSGSGAVVDESRQKINAYFVEASAAAMNQNPKEAALLFTKVIELDPINHAAMYNIGRIRYDEGDFVSAASWAQKAIKIDKTNFWYYALLADANERLGKYNETANVLSELTSKFPENYQSFLNLSHIYI